MTESDIGPFVARIHAAPTRIVLAITGGGSRAIGQLLEMPGGSRTLLEAVVPYSAAALREWLAATPENYCSAATARAMAMAAFWRARQLAAAVAPDGASAADSPLAGVACTASLASDRPKRGAHRIHVALQTIAATVTHSIELAKGRRGRSDEEVLAARLVLNAVAEAGGSADRLPQSAASDEPLLTTSTVAPAAWQELLAGTVPAVRHSAGAIARHAAPSAAAATRRALFAGAFHPLHAGHRRMAELAERILAMPVEFEISIENVDKPPLDFTEMAERLKQFSPEQSVWFTRAPTFVRKAELFRGATFIVGADTIRRIADPRYYGGDPSATAAVLERIAASGSRFLVFGRLSDGRFETLDQLVLPESLSRLCTAVPPEQFRHDVSSTTLRRTPAGEET